MPRPAIRPRKNPVQQRSTDLVAAILQAAIRVLEEEGAQRFTTIRVAERAGVSVGSLYQYFPNKQAILYRLQVDEWGRTGDLLDSILSDATRSPPARLRAMMRAFFHSEHEEAPLRLALDAAAPSWGEDVVEARGKKKRESRVVSDFIRAAAPKATPRERKFAAELLWVVAGSVGKKLSETQRSKPEIDRWADAISALLIHHLVTLGR